MKYIVIIGLLFLSSCCVVTSQDCFCDDSDRKVNEEGLKWVLPYENQSYFIFKNTEGDIDSLKVERISEVDYCGGDECEYKCDIEKSNLSSLTDSEIQFQINVNSSNLVYVNSGVGNKNIALSFSLSNDYTFVSEKFSLIRTNDSFRIDCKNNANCFGYPMKGMIFTKQEGLIEYTTADNRKWTKVN